MRKLHVLTVDEDGKAMVNNEQVANKWHTDDESNRGMHARQSDSD